MHANLLLINGRIITLAGRPCEGLAIIGDRIAADGTTADLLALRGPRTRVVDLQGRCAVPGFTDSHVHLAALASRLSEVKLESAGSLAEALRRVAQCAKSRPRGEWITGGGFDKNKWGDAFPTRHDLDRVAPHHPVSLRTRDGHSVWANSLALRLCGIRRGSRSPSGGVVVTDGDGEPTGVLQETAIGLLHQCPDYRERTPAGATLVAAQRLLLRQGVTSIHVMEEADTLAELQQSRTSGNLLLRTTVYRGLHHLDDLIAAGVTSGLGDEWLRIGGVKMLIDGSLGSQTAWMFLPYQNAPRAACGVATMSRAELRDAVERAARAGIACAIHAIGDRANAEVLDALQSVSHMPTPLPHRVEHAQLLRPRDMARFARMRVIASMQPCHILGDIDMAERYWGKRSRHAYALRSLLARCATLAFGSDAPVETADPIKGVYAAVARQTLEGRPAGGWYRREEGIGVIDAIRAYCLGPAVATGESHVKGQLAAGYLADVAVLSEDVTKLRGRALLRARADMTVVGGRVYYRRRGAW
ncbi:MAG: amidohydrolase [Armatimonadota bacterium]